MPTLNPLNPQQLIKNLPISELFDFAGTVDYQEGRVVSRTIAQNAALSATLFAFDVGEEVGTHSAPGDALASILDGEAQIVIGDKTLTVPAGQAVVMPRDVPHSLLAVKRFKMFLLLVKPLP